MEKELAGELNFYQHGFFGSLDSAVQQRVNLFDSKSPGIYQFIEIVEDNDDDDNEEPPIAWILKHESFDKKITQLWKGNLKQGILDAVVKEFIK
jgi:hypothetical protein